MSDTGNFISRITGKIINAANSDKKMKCLGKCGGKITPHIAISYSECEEGVENFLAALNDYVPVSPILLGNMYACTECRKVRFEGGLGSNRANKMCDDYL